LPISSYPTSLQELSDCLLPRAGQVVTLNHRDFEALKFDQHPPGFMQHVMRGDDDSAYLTCFILTLTKESPDVAGNEGRTAHSFGRYVDLLKIIDSLQMQRLHLDINDNCAKHGTSVSIVENLVRLLWFAAFL